jgi:hypothetical protein
MLDCWSYDERAFERSTESAKRTVPTSKAKVRTTWRFSIILDSALVQRRVRVQCFSLNCFSADPFPKIWSTRPQNLMAIRTPIKYFPQVTVLTRCASVEFLAPKASMFGSQMMSLLDALLYTLAQPFRAHCEPLSEL